MGNSTTKISQFYDSKLKELNKADSTATSNDILKHWSCDLLSVILSYSQRIEQIRLINLIFSNDLSQYKDELRNVLDHLVTTPFTEHKMISNFNEKYYQNVLNKNNIKNSDYLFLFFNNIKLIGKTNNIQYLKDDKNSVVYTFLLYLSRKDFFQRNKTNISLEIDPFIEGFKKNKKQDFEANEAFFIDDEKLENIKYKNQYIFNTFKRNMDSVKYDTLTWKQFNDVYIQNLLNYMLNSCGDNMKIDNMKSINYGIDENESLNILIAPTLFYGLNGYCISLKKSKHTSFVGQMDAHHSFRKAKKTAIATSKYIHVCFFNWSQHNISVITMMNKQSSDHIKEAINVGKRIMWAYVDSAVMNIR